MSFGVRFSFGRSLVVPINDIQNSIGAIFDSVRLDSSYFKCISMVFVRILDDVGY